MHALQGRDKVIVFALMVSIGLVLSVAKAGAMVIEGSPDISRILSGTPETRGGITGFGLAVDAERPDAGFDTGQAALVSTRLLDPAWAATIPYATDYDAWLPIPADPFGLRRVQSDATTTGDLATVDENARAVQGLPVVLSAGAVMVTSVLGWRLIARPRARRRKKTRRRRSSGSAGAGAHETTSIGDVIHYIAGSITPRFLKRKKRSRRRSSALHSPTADGAEIVVDVARAVVETITPPRRRRKHRRKSRRSTAAQHDMRPT